MRGIFHQSGNFLHALRIARHNRQGGALQIGFGQAKMENVRLCHFQTPVKGR